MNRLTRIIAPALAASLALAIAAPASAAQWEGQRNSHGYAYDNGIGREIAQLDRQVDIAKALHQISAREAASLERKVDGLQRLYRVYSRNGLSRGELNVLDRRIDSVKRDLARQAHDRDGRAERSRDDGHFAKGDDGHRR